MTNRIVGVNKKEVATTQQLSNIFFIEKAINKTIIDGINKRLYYKTIYQNCKEALESFTNVLI